jgi:hypothetical protein
MSKQWNYTAVYEGCHKNTSTTKWNYSVNTHRVGLSRGGVRSTRGLGPNMTTRGQSISFSIGMLPQTLIMSRLDQLAQRGARI